MNINWLLADSVFLDPGVDIAVLKEIGSLWGSWKTWRMCQTDNVVCHDHNKALELLGKNFQNFCNFYIPNSVYKTLEPPPNKLHKYEGDFAYQVDNKDEIVALNLVATVSNIVLLLGFDWSTNVDPDDTKRRTYQGLTAHTIKSQPDIQFVLIDHPGKLASEFAGIENLSQDTMSNVLALLKT